MSDKPTMSTDKGKCVAPTTIMKDVDDKKDNKTRDGGRGQVDTPVGGRVGGNSDKESRCSMDVDQGSEGKQSSPSPTSETPEEERRSFHIARSRSLHDYVREGQRGYLQRHEASGDPRESRRRHRRRAEIVLRDIDAALNKNNKKQKARSLSASDAKRGDL